MNNKNVLLGVVIGAVVFFVVVLPLIDKQNKKETKKIKEKLENATNSLGKIDQRRCSRDCCKHTQWPVSHNVLSGEIPQAELDTYVSNNFGCTWGQGSGCPCVTKADFNALSARGGNA
jgi:hypothetical protein